MATDSDSLGGGLNSLAALQTYITDNFLPFELAEGDAAYYHLEALGCVSIQGLQDTQVGEAFYQTYPGIFSKGFTEMELPEELRAHVGTGLFAPCLHDNGRLQFNAVTLEQLELRLNEVGLTDLLESAKSTESSHRMSGEEIQAYLADLSPEMAAFITRWNEGVAKHVRLTSVGTAIAHSNYRRVTGLSAPLSVWIS